MKQRMTVAVLCLAAVAGGAAGCGDNNKDTSTAAPAMTAPQAASANIVALAKDIAGDGLVCVTAGDVGGQAFSAGRVDEVAMDVVPVVMGEGVRFFGNHTGTVLLDDPDMMVQGTRVLHLHYTVNHDRN